MKKVMIVDDSVFLFEEMKMMLKDSDFEIAGYARSGEEALEMLEKMEMPDVVTMDIILPGMDGIETARRMMEHWGDMNVIVISSLAYDETTELAAGVGAKDILFKPFEKEILIDALSRAVE